MSILFTKLKFQVNASYSFEKLRNDNVAVQTLGTNQDADKFKVLTKC